MRENIPVATDIATGPPEFYTNTIGLTLHPLFCIPVIIILHLILLKFSLPILNLYRNI
jgi:hypothetical protein